MKRSKKGVGKFRSVCPIASTLDLVGDKWSLLVVRDLLRGRSTYGELASAPEKIPTNILADRLRRLEDAGLIESSAYQERPVRYAYKLSAKGEALEDVLRAFVTWGKAHIPGTKTYTEVARSNERQTAARAGSRKPSRNPR
ncbi:MAG TPA: helix-turn-helix domain-containing protein [Pyrinomonadaceae bacterium]|nr:helix-turn-helix domain-containing protein [Pyrinomonadaceae bacterium]